MTGPTPRSLQWTPELVAQFWDNLAQTKLLDLAFSKLAGPYLLKVVRPHLVESQRHLDFGSGDGHLARLLTAQGFPTAVYEPSEFRLATLRKIMDGADGFLGCVGSDSEPFDTVLMIEVIEHILDAELDTAMGLIDRLLKPDGTLIVTTPNNEPLDYGMCVEPASGVVFHRWQHVRSFTRETLTELLDRYGFEPIVIHDIEFSDRIFGQAAAQLAADGPLGNIFNTSRRIHLGDGNGLVYIGRRKGTMTPSDKTAAEISRLSHPIVVQAATHLNVVGSPTLPSPAGLPSPEPGRFEISIPTESIRHVAGHEWAVSFEGCLFPDDTMDAPTGSSLELFEDALPLGPAHSDRALVQTVGRGSYCHRGSTIHFSASDNSAANSNGRRYILTVPTPKIVAPTNSAPAPRRRLPRNS